MFNILLGIILAETVVAPNWGGPGSQNGRVLGFFNSWPRGLSGILTQG